MRRVPTSKALRNSAMGHLPGRCKSELRSKPLRESSGLRYGCRLRGATRGRPMTDVRMALSEPLEKGPAPTCCQGWQALRSGVALAGLVLVAGLLASAPAAVA